MLSVDLSELPAAVADELIRGRHAKDTMTVLKAPETQLSIAKQNHATQWKSMDGIGAPTLSITADAYHYWGRRLGYECWKDKQFLREFKRDNPECRIKAAGTRIQSGAMGVATETQRPQRFHKSYG